MPWEYTDDYYREYTRTTWNETSGVYQRFARNLESYRQDLLADLHLKPGDRALDLGTGPGEPALTIAGLVGQVR